MLVRHLSYFITLAREKHFARAAALSNVAQPHHGMTSHISGTSISAQTRYAAGTREILECWFEDRPILEEYLIVDGGKLAGAGAHAYSAGNATGSSDEAARFKTV